MKRNEIPNQLIIIRSLELKIFVFCISSSAFLYASHSLITVISFVSLALTTRTAEHSKRIDTISIEHFRHSFQGPCAKSTPQSHRHYYFRNFNCNSILCCLPTDRPCVRLSTYRGGSRFCMSSFKTHPPLSFITFVHKFRCAHVNSQWTGNSLRISFDACVGLFSPHHFTIMRRISAVCTHKEIRAEEVEEVEERMEITRSCNNAYVEHITS